MCNIVGQVSLHLEPKMVLSCTSAQLFAVVDREIIISDASSKQTSANGDCGHSGRFLVFREAVAEKHQMFSFAVHI